MKRICALLLTFLVILTFSGCAEEEEHVPDRQILMIKVYQNFAWGRQQDITVIDRDGNCRSQSAGVENEADEPAEWVNFSEDGWYERLVEIAENGEPEDSVSTRKLSLIRQNVQKFGKWADLPEKEYSDLQMCDFGQITLYGVYFDGEEPRLAWLATYGDSQKCADSSEVRKFVNRLSMLKFKYT